MRVKTEIFIFLVTLWIFIALASIRPLDIPLWFVGLIYTTGYILMKLILIYVNRDNHQSKSMKPEWKHLEKTIKELANRNRKGRYR